MFHNLHKKTKYFFNKIFGSKVEEMKCHYEVLNLPRDAEESEIKKAYRKLALQWHPDKNLDNPDEAREQFQLIQQAYEVLSDPIERAWYDNHREQILRGRNSDYEDNCLDVFQYFTVTCFKGYGDDPGGFYAIYSEIFKKIAAEDIEFMDDEEIQTIPEFGNSNSSYEEVVGPFYAHWQSYCTKRTYSWLCKYNIAEIKDRRILREIEKETKKLAQKAKKERNEEVRSLVSFVKKRDKRVQAYRKQLEEKAELNRKKQEQNRLEQIRKRQKEVEEMKKTHTTHKPDDYEQQLRLIEQEYGGSSDEYTDDEGEIEYEESLELLDNQIVEENEGENIEDNYVDDLYCVACDKTFKNKKALTNHQSSEKHKINIDKLIKETLKEDRQIHPDTSENDTKIYTDDQATEEQSYVENGNEAYSTKKSKNKKSKKSGKNSSVIYLEEPEEIPDLLADLSVEEENWNEDKKGTKKGRNKKQLSSKNNFDKISETENCSSSNIKEDTSEDITNRINNKSEDIDIGHVCVTCKAVFPSKNKLFNHLKQKNHGVYIPKLNEQLSSGGAISKNKGKKK